MIPTFTNYCCCILYSLKNGKDEICTKVRICTAGSTLMLENHKYACGKVRCILTLGICNQGSPKQKTWPPPNLLTSEVEGVWIVVILFRYIANNTFSYIREQVTFSRGMRKTYQTTRSIFLKPFFKSVLFRYIRILK